MAAIPFLETERAERPRTDSGLFGESRRFLRRIRGMSKQVNQDSPSLSPEAAPDDFRAAAEV
jgi:hypothetical protein